MICHVLCVVFFHQANQKDASRTSTPMPIWPSSCRALPIADVTLLPPPWGPGGSEEGEGEDNWGGDTQILDEALTY